MAKITNQGLNSALHQLWVFSLSGDFWQVLDTAFGTEYNRENAQILRLQWQKGDFSQLPQMEIVDGGILGDGNGAYSSSENRIYLSSKLIEKGTLGLVSKVLIEEIGHYVDAYINTVDSPGDEGAIFAALVQGEVLSPNVLAELRNENDGGWLEVNGQNLEVEYNNPTVSLSLTSPSTVTEDGPQNLFYVFSRTGDVKNSLTVNFNVSGSATLNDDYVQRGATSFGTSTGSATFAAGSSVVILSLDPSSDVVSDGNETVALTLAAGTGYAVGTSSAVTGTILDNDVAPGTVVRGSVAKSEYFRTRHEYHNIGAFAALKSDGSVVTWGFSDWGGNSSSVSSSLTSGVTQIFSTGYAFAALKSDGSVVTWGDSSFGGNSSSVSSSLTSGVTQIFSTLYAFAALKSDGSVVTWGIPEYGGDSSSVSSSLTSGVTQIFSNDSAFAALKSDGSVVTWGNSGRGGNSSSVSSSLTSGVTQIFSNDSAFAALKSDGSVVTWGYSFYSFYGGDSSSVSSSLTSGVTQIFSTVTAFAALKSDGSVVTWGDSRYGGSSSSVSSSLTSGVTQIFSTGGAFAALKSDGSVVTWGDSGAGGSSSSVSSSLTSGVTQIFSTGVAFAALKSDGSVVTWGDSGWGGDSSSVSSRLTSGVTQIFSTGSAFAALKSDGSVVTWGDSRYGGNSSSVSSSLTSGVTQIFSTVTAFAALKSDGSVVTWGDSGAGGSSSSVSSQLTSGVVSFADPFNDDRLVPLSTTPTTPTITLAVNPSSVTEDGTTNLVYTLTRTGDLANSLIVNVNGGGTAVLGTDFSISGPIRQSTSGSIASVTFAAGSSTATVIVDPIPNSIPGGNKTVFATLAPGVGYNIGTVGAVTGTILEDDVVAPTLAIASTGATQTEGNSGKKAFPFTVTRSGDTTSSSSANWAVTGFGTNQADVTDFGGTLPTGTVNFTAGETSKTIIVDVLGDTTVEPDEGFTVTLSNPTNATITTATAVGTIINDDDNTGSIQGLKWKDINGNGVREDLIQGDSPNIVFVIDVSGSTGNPFQGIPVGDVNKDGTPNTILDAEIAGFIALNNSLVSKGLGSTAKVSIVSFESDAKTLLTTNPETDSNKNGTKDVEEKLISLGFLGGTNFEIALQEAAKTLRDIGTTAGNGNVIFMSDGQPNPGNIYTDEVLALQNAGVKLSAFGVGTGASIDSLKLINPNASIFTSTDQLLGVFDGLGSGTRSFKEPGLGGVSIYLDLNNNGVLDIGEPNQLTASDDRSTTNDEEGQYSFTNLQPGTYIVREVVTSSFSQTFPNNPDYHTAVVASGQTVNNINFGNTTPSPITLKIQDQSVTEDGTNNLIYTFTRSGNLTNALTVNYSVAGKAIFNTDYNQTGAASFTATGGTVTFATGLSTATVTIDPIADTTVEGDETVELTLAPGTGYNIDTTSVVTGTITNDDRTLTPITDYAPNVNISTGLVFSTNGGGNLSLDTNRLSMSNEVTGVQNGTKSNFNHLFGLYEVLNAQGEINTEKGVLKPGDSDYAFYALTTARVKDFIVQAGNSDIPSTATQLGSGVSLQGNKFYAPFVIANCGTYFPNLQQGVEDFIAAENGDVNRFANAPKHVRDLVATEVGNEFNNAPRFVQEPVAYFSFGSANPDKSPHLRSYGNGVYGFEDLPATATQYSNNDFNDAVFALS
ncbi:Calx-beta domain-containing protein [Cylindrospermopsis raciborskii]|uniref:Calx-beta domain-containing protein n=1 Tax=Cylindrospermopsis raciborskii TaxID=77022 RepID=UPI001BA51EB1|nr:Calx-beta domain-containing protein [Cylindrospermopsis raciborskii]